MLIYVPSDFPTCDFPTCMSCDVPTCDVMNAKGLDLTHHTTFPDLKWAGDETNIKLPTQYHHL